MLGINVWMLKSIRSSWGFCSIWQKKRPFDVISRSFRLRYLVYFFPFFPAFLASISLFASKRFFDLYGRLEVFFFGLNAIIRVMSNSIY